MQFPRGPALAHHRQGVVQARADAKVGDLGLPPQVHQQVGGLDVTVDHAAVLVEELHALRGGDGARGGRKENGSERGCTSCEMSLRGDYKAMRGTDELHALRGGDGRRIRDGRGEEMRHCDREVHRMAEVVHDVTPREILSATQRAHCMF